MATADLDRVWDLMESMRFCMLSNWDGTKLRSRPMGAFVRRGESAIYFFTDARSHKDDEICRHPQVWLAFADSHSQDYLSVSGAAEISSDRAKISELWSIPAKLWWKDPQDPNIRLLKVTPTEAEYWDSPGNLVSNFKVAFALLTGRHLDPGEHKSVSM